MPSASTGAVTRLLRAWSAGDSQAQEELLPRVYNELRRRAAGHLRRDGRDHTLQPTALDVAHQHADLVRELRSLVARWEADVDAEGKERTTQHAGVCGIADPRFSTLVRHIGLKRLGASASGDRHEAVRLR